MKMASKTGSITVIIALRNSESTIKDALESLDKQKDKGLVREIIIIDNRSTDNSPRIIRKYAKKSHYKVKYIVNKKDLGLAGSFNRGISRCRSEYAILMHSDVVVEDTDAFSKALAPFARDPKAVVAKPTIVQPYYVWKKFSFWQKCFFRTYDVEAESLLGKFDCFRKPLLLKKVGLFDNVVFRTAGEDVDMSIRIHKAGLKETGSGVRVIHLHSKDDKFTAGMLIRKESQYAEGSFPIILKHGADWFDWLSDKKFVLKIAFRPLVVIGLLVPYVQYAALVLLIAYSIWVSRKVYQNERGDPRLLLLPFVNMAVLFFYTFYMLRGLVTGKQRL